MSRSRTSLASVVTFARRSALVAALALSAASASATFTEGTAQAATTPTTFLQEKQNKVRTLLQGPASADREKKIDAELASLIDYDEMAKASLGAGTKDDEYGNRKPEELKEFTDLLRQLVEKNYKKRLNDTLKYDIKYNGEEPKDGDVLVKTTAKDTSKPKDEPVTIDYRVRKKNGNYVVVDIVTEGSSMAHTYHKEFAKIIKNQGGFPAVIKRMKDKLAKS